MSTVVVALDFSEVTDSVIQATEQTAKALGANVYLLHVESPNPDFVGYEPGPQHVRDNVAHKVADHMDRLHELRDRLRDADIDTESLVIQGPTVEKILEEAKRLSADRIVIGSHGHGALYNLLVGSVCEGVLKGSTCPVLVVPDTRKHAG